MLTVSINSTAFHLIFAELFSPLARVSTPQLLLWTRTRYVTESRWHHSQQLTLEKDGSLIAEFRLTDTQEIKRWIMSFGPSATVLEPQELVEDVLADLNIMRHMYGKLNEQEVHL